MASSRDRSSTRPGALGGIRICDFSGQLAGAVATKWLAAFGAEVIRIEDPLNDGRWDILRGAGNLSRGFNNHNAEKLGVTINLRDERGKELLSRLVEVSDVVTENFTAGVLERWGFGWETLRSINPRIIYVSSSGFGHHGPYSSFRAWGPIVQACSGLTSLSGLRGHPPAGWGYSYMDHMGAHFMALAILAALVRREATGEGERVDLATTEAGASLLGPAVLDYTVNGRPFRRPGMPDSNHSQYPLMVPHSIYPARGNDEWVAIACRDDDEWDRIAETVEISAGDRDCYRTLADRLRRQDELDDLIAGWTSSRDKFEIAAQLQRRLIPAAAVQRPVERVDSDANTAAWGLFPTVSHPEIGDTRIEGLPVHLSETDWDITRGGPCLGQHNEFVYEGILGMSAAEIDELRAAEVI